MKKNKIDFENWERKEHYKFFSNFENPMFTISSEVDCRNLYEYSKENEYSFFLVYIFTALKVAHKIKEFRYRIIENEIYDFSSLDASPTINRPDNTFGFAYFKNSDNFVEFSQNASQEIEKVKAEKGLIPAVNNENLIHFSSVPWMYFTNLNLASFSLKNDSIPKITFGKFKKIEEKYMLPIAVCVNHRLMDGFHVSEFFRIFQEYCNEPKKIF